MYSGTTLTRLSGSLLGAHQKIDRIAVKQLGDLIEVNQFPSISQILHFEGCNGPDGIKRKSPAKDEPWHFFQPYNLKDTELIAIIESHYRRLVASLIQKDEVRASFEAAWMAHAIVDGLTPAHHFPYAEKIKELRGGQAHSDRSSVKEKLLIPGATLRLQFSNNWKFWGPKGLLITHAAFEYGVATVLKTFSIKEPLAAIESSSLITENNLGQWYRETAQKIYKLAIYDRFYESGWNRALIKDVRQQLLPLIINSVTLSWYGAIHTANLKS